MKRVCIGVVCLMLLFSLNTPFVVDATSVDSDNLYHLTELLQFQSPSNSILSGVAEDHPYLVYKPTLPSSFNGCSYIDIIFSSSREITDFKTVSSTKFNINDLTLVRLNNSESPYYYRAYGPVDYSTSQLKYFAFRIYPTPGLVTTRIEFLSIKADLNGNSFLEIPLGMAITLTALNQSEDLVLPPSSSGVLNLPPFGANDYDPRYFSCLIWASESSKVDYVDFFIQFYGVQTDSVSADYGGVDLPMDLNFINSGSDANFSEQICQARVYLTGVQRDPDEDVTLRLNGTYDSAIEGGYINFVSCIGFIDTYSISPIELLWFKLEKLLNNLLGSTDSDANNALTTQEEINVSVNNQLVGAVEDWNTHIEAVETGYDMAFTQTTPALNWIASLANGIYSGLGWFGRLYLLIGLVSVFMLVLSKSGLARKIGSGIRRGG